MFTISSSLEPDSGFHTCSKSVVQISSAPELHHCSLNLHFVLPPFLFVDLYELQQRNASYSFLHHGVNNLELPVAALPRENSELLLNVHYARVPSGIVTVEVEVPLHARYGEPAAEGESPFVVANVPKPGGFVACSRDTHAPVSSDNLPEMSPQFTALYDLEASTFIKLAPAGSSAHTPDTLRIPIGSISHLAVVETGTAFCIVALFFYLLHAMLSTYKTLNASRHAKRE
ncbi:Protein PBN1 [Pleurotus pulmonarius]